MLQLLPASHCSTCLFQNTRHSLSGQNNPEYRLKEKYFLRKAEINDLDDTEGNYIIYLHLLCLNTIFFFRDKPRLSSFVIG